MRRRRDASQGIASFAGSSSDGVIVSGETKIWPRDLTFGGQRLDKIYPRPPGRAAQYLNVGASISKPSALAKLPRCLEDRYGFPHRCPLAVSATGEIERNVTSSTEVMVSWYPQRRVGLGAGLLEHVRRRTAGWAATELLPTDHLRLRQRLVPPPSWRRAASDVGNGWACRRPIGTRPALHHPRPRRVQVCVAESHILVGLHSRRSRHERRPAKARLPQRVHGSELLRQNLVGMVKHPSYHQQTHLQTAAFAYFKRRMLPQLSNMWIPLL